MSYQRNYTRYKNKKKRFDDKFNKFKTALKGDRECNKNYEELNKDFNIKLSRHLFDVFKIPQHIILPDKVGD